MSKNRVLRYVLICVLFVSFTGCAGLQRKFVRKKKKEERVAPVITTYDYAKDLRVDELYKKRFLYWKSWQGELIERMDGTYKKRRECYEHLVMNLMEMKKYLSDAKIKELDPFIEEIESIDSDIRKKRLSENKKIRMGHLLERTKRQIDKKFSYSNVKDSLEFKK